MREKKKLPSTLVWEVIVTPPDYMRDSLGACSSNCLPNTKVEHCCSSAVGSSIYKSMALHHVLLIFIIIVLWTNVANVQARRDEEVAREFRRGEDMKERRTRKFDEMVLSTARGYGKRTNGQLRNDFLLEWIAMERMRDMGYPSYVMNNAELTPE